MARPRVFVSSTYYDLKHIRHSLDIFIEGLGYDSILSEKGDIAYAFDIALDESCYKEVNNVDIFVLIIGGRYGSEISGDKDPEKEKEFYDRYESITQKEYETAVAKDIPVYILIEASVNSEYKTFQRNRDSKDMKYAHVDSINIFHFMESTLLQKRNNPVKTFEKFDEIEKWLKEQWAGLFREFIHRKSEQNQIKTLTTEIEGLRELNNTLKIYMEAILNKTHNSKSIIASETKRLDKINAEKELEKNRWYSYCRRCGIAQEDILPTIKQAKSFEDYLNLVQDKSISNRLRNVLSQTDSKPRRDFNECRKSLGLKTFSKVPNQAVE